MIKDERVARLLNLINVAFYPPAGIPRILMALSFGFICHGVFAAAILAMITAMFFGLSESLGTVPWPWAILANLILIVQFPLAHLVLLSKSGGTLLRRLIPGPHGDTLATTTYGI